MIVRSRILPRSLSDMCSMIFILTIIPLIYWFELWVVFPELFKDAFKNYIFHFILGNFMMINIVGNFTYAVLHDTSVERTIIPVSQASVQNGWRLCVTCETLAPARSWHCNTCNVCILKRDHHCIFMGCCIGHFNHRFFLVFLFYMLLATSYAFFYNNYFIWNRIHFEFPMSIIKIIFPLAIFAFGFDDSMDQFYLLLYIICLIGMLYTSVLFTYHMQLVLNGCVANESNKKDYTYNFGWQQNMKEVFGKRWYLTWIFPYIKSDLPQNGIVWHKGFAKRE